MEPADSCNTLSNRPQRGRTEARKLANFLNDLFEGEFQIKDVTFKDKEQLGDTNDLRGCIFDIYCVTDDDKHFIVSSIFLFLSLIRVRKNARQVLKNGFMF